MLSIIVLILLIGFIIWSIYQSYQFEPFEIIERFEDNTTNNCNKPLNVVCDSETVYGDLHALQSKIDQIEFNLSKYDDMYKQWEASRREVTAISEEANKEAQAKAQAIIGDKLTNIQAEAEESRRAQGLAHQQSEANRLKVAQEGIKFSGNSPEAKIAQETLNKSSKAGSQADQEDLQKSIKSINMPKGLVF
jgi:hypothetical protein